MRRDAQDFEAAWKLSRVDYWLGGHAPESERRQFLDAGVAAGRTAVAIAPTAPTAISGSPRTWARSPSPYGMGAGLKYRKPVKEELDTLLRIISFMQGLADRVLGRWYSRCRGSLAGAGSWRSNISAPR